MRSTPTPARISTRLARHGAIALTMVQSACASMHGAESVETGLAELARGDVDRARVTVASGTVVMLYSPRVQGDSVVGFRDRGSRTRLAIPRDSVRVVETEQLDRGRSALGLIGISAAVTAGVILAALLLLSTGS